MKAPTLHGERIELRAIQAADLDALHRILRTPAVARWWNPHTREELEEWLADDDVIRWTIHVGGEPVGKIQAHEDGDALFRHAGIDIYLDPAAHGRGLGQECMAVVARWLFAERKQHRLVIDPALANERAIRCYEAVGFRRVGVMRRYWLDHTTGDWADGLLLDMLDGELRLPQPVGAGGEGHQLRS